jgi:hypothetical protein
MEKPKKIILPNTKIDPEIIEKPNRCYEKNNSYNENKYVIHFISLNIIYYSFSQISLSNNDSFVREIDGVKISW